jgi:FG-GAP-like repeat
MSSRKWFCGALLLIVGLAWGCRPTSTGNGDADAGDSGVTGDASILGDGTVPPDAEVCQTTLCGTPPVCCTTDEECVSDQCLPTCASGVRCGSGLETCCAAGDVCLNEVCATPGNTCTDSYDCEQPGEFCEPTLGQCLPQPDPLTCETTPSFSQLSVTEEWSFLTDEIISIPVVGDINGDSVPEVVLNLTQQDGEGWPGGTIVVLNGQTGAELLRIPHDPTNDQWGSHGRTTIAIGDVSGDGLPDILYATRTVNASGQSYLVAVDSAGTLLWIAHDSSNTNYPITVVNAAVTLANFDADAEAEIVIGAVLIDHDGLVVWDEGGGGGGGAYGTNTTYTGGISAVADLDGDSAPEIVSGRNAWQVDWQPGTNPGDPPAVTVTPYWTYAGPDGYPAVADFNSDGTPEVVVVGSGEVAVLNGQTGTLWCGVDPTDAVCQADPAQRTQPILIPGGASLNQGGPPTVADFDADGRPEIGVAGGYAYTVYDVNRPGEVIVQPTGDPLPTAGAIYVRWSQTTQDLSSNATGSSVFDFQGDGAAEVVYADECFLRVYSGTDGTVQLELPSSSATIHEYPLVVDVDADGNSEILIVTNHLLNCPHASRQGLFVYGDPNDEWVPTRRVWTQHTYHVSNATSDGNVPLSEADNWTTAGLNNYRQNVQGDGVFNAPDLTVDLTIGLSLCGQGQLELRARVSNIGALGVLPGVDVSFFEGIGASATLLGSDVTTVPLLPGASTVVTLAVAAPTALTDYSVTVAGNSASLVVAECDPDNNTDDETTAGCPVVN